MLIHYFANYARVSQVTRNNGVKIIRQNIKNNFVNWLVLNSFLRSKNLLIFVYFTFNFLQLKKKLK